MEAIDNDVLILLGLLLRKRLRKKRKYIRRRKYWVHFLLAERYQKGLYPTLYCDLRNHPVKFFQYFRMSVKSFDELLSILQVHIKGQDTNMRKCITPVEKLILTIRYLATGCSIMELHFAYRYGVNTISGIIREVCGAIWNIMRETCIPKPTEEMWIKVAKEFERTANFPNSIGAIDGKHIRVIKPRDSGSLFYNYKHFFSLLLLAVCDADYRFLFIDVGAYGKSSDSTVYKNSVFYKKVSEKQMNIPKERCLPNSNVSCPFVLIGDEGFGISNFLLRPYGGKFLTVTKRVYNYRLSRARRYIECTFGILANKWRIFHRPLNVALDFAELLVQASCVLHNFVRERDGYKFEHTLSVEGFYDMPNYTIQGGRSANSIRDAFSKHFMEEGQVPWQLNKI